MLGGSGDVSHEHHLLRTSQRILKLERFMRDQVADSLPRLCNRSTEPRRSCRCKVFCKVECLLNSENIENTSPKIIFQVKYSLFTSIGSVILGSGPLTSFSDSVGGVCAVSSFSNSSSVWVQFVRTDILFSLDSPIWNS